MLGQKFWVYIIWKSPLCTFYICTFSYNTPLYMLALGEIILYHKWDHTRLSCFMSILFTDTQMHGRADARMQGCSHGRTHACTHARTQVRTQNLSKNVWHPILYLPSWHKWNKNWVRKCFKSTTCKILSTLFCLSLLWFYGRCRCGR